MKPRKGKAGPYLLALAFLFLLWPGAALALKTEALPGPVSVMTSFVKEMGGSLASHFFISTYRVLASLILALLAAVPVGIAMGRIKRADALASPLVYLTYPVPKIAFLPLVLLLFGIGDSSKIFLIAFILFFQILVTTRDAAREIPREHILSQMPRNCLLKTKVLMLRHLLTYCTISQRMQA